MINQRFERLTVIAMKPGMICVCKCDCGVVKDVRKYELIRGDTKSCGCLKKERAKERMTVHGYANREDKKKGYSREYRIWMTMRSRCRNPKTIAYDRYGGRGISVCERWDNFELFIEDMGCAPSAKHSIDRINNDGNYCPENCKWSSHEEQQSNTSKSRYIECRGETKTLSEWARVSGNSATTIHSRIRRGWDIEEAIYKISFKEHRSDFWIK